MMLTINNQLTYKLLTVGVGVVLGFVFDWYSYWFRRRKPKGIWRWVWDFTFCLVLFLFFVYYLIRLVWGDLRLWMAVALGVGLFLYHRLIRANKKILGVRRRMAGLPKKLANKNKVTNK